MKEMLAENIGECDTKLELVNDYLQRFKITDPLLTSPIMDIERCISFLKHFVQFHMGPNGDEI